MNSRQVTTPKANILIVDDTPANLRLLTGILVEHGYKVRAAPNGALALQAAQSDPPDLILLDIMMPGMDGYAVCVQLKGDERTRDIPVIFLSALTEAMDKVKAFAVGGVDYVSKPFQTVEVLARVETHLALRNLQRQLEDRNAQLAAANTEITALNRRLDGFFRQFATGDVADQLLQEGFALGGKHVEATAMFADIRGFTGILESQSPDLTIALLNDYYAHVMEAITSEGGVINQVVGDGLMCIFGAPVHHEDCPQRAVRAALKMMEHLELFNQEQIARDRVPIRVGIGIATGTGVAGYIGTQARTSYTWVSNATVVAFRLDAYTKEVGKQILIDENTRQALGDSLQVEDEGWVDLRGKARAVHVYSVPVGQKF